MTLAQRDRITRQVVEEGYFDLEPVLSDSDTLPILGAIRAITNAGLPPVFCFVYDEIWQMFARLNQVVEPILDPDFRLQTAGNWAWYIDNRDAGFQPHRDIDHYMPNPTGDRQI